MTQKPVKHILGTGEELDYVRLTAEPGRGITNDGGESVWNCVDVLPAEVESWADCALPPDPDEPATEEDYEAALARLGVSL